MAFRPSIEHVFEEMADPRMTGQIEARTRFTDVLDYGSTDRRHFDGNDAQTRIEYVARYGWSNGGHPRSSLLHT
jgi:hypothetical protein